MNPRYPVYIPSKGRAFADSRLTYHHLERMGVPYRLIVEEGQVSEYAKIVPRDRLLVLDRSYQRDYDTFDDLGDARSKGPGPARNFAWDHAISLGAEWHWVMDDNINGFFRLHHNLKTPVADGTIFRCMEDFCARYERVAMAGPNYFMFAKRKDAIPPFIVNTRIYSCNLIRNDAPFRWRGRYNEDTDLSLRMLKSGWNTVQFNAFLQCKAPTQTIRGGNTAEFYHAEGLKIPGQKYAQGGTSAKSQMLVDMHPDVARLTHKFGREHHSVDYRRFKRDLVLREGVQIPDGPDNYGMVLLSFESSEAARAWDEARLSARLVGSRG